MNISNAYEDAFDDLPGLISYSLYVDVNDSQIASVQFECEDLETLARVKSTMAEILDRYDANFGFTTEFTFSFVERYDRSTKNNDVHLKTCENCENNFPGTLLECPKCGYSEPTNT